MEGKITPQIAPAPTPAHAPAPAPALAPRASLDADDGQGADDGSLISSRDDKHAESITRIESGFAQGEVAHETVEHRFCTLLENRLCWSATGPAVR